MQKTKHFLAIALLLMFVIAGCAEGPLARFGNLNPWARKKWAEEEQMVETYYARRQRLRDLASQASELPPEDQERYSRELAELLHHDPITLIRLEAVRSLAEFPTYTASTALKGALNDSDPDVRAAVCAALAQRRHPESVPALQHVVGSDANIDVRLAATRALGSFEGESTVKALAIALEDPDPAMQYRAMQSLRKVTGHDYGRDLVAWREFIRGGSPPVPTAPSMVDRLRKLF